MLRNLRAEGTAVEGCPRLDAHSAVREFALHPKWPSRAITTDVPFCALVARPAAVVLARHSVPSRVLVNADSDCSFCRRRCASFEHGAAKWGRVEDERQPLSSIKHPIARSVLSPPLKSGSGVMAISSRKGINPRACSRWRDGTRRDGQASSGRGGRSLVSTSTKGGGPVSATDPLATLRAADRSVVASSVLIPREVRAARQLCSGTNRTEERTTDERSQLACSDEYHRGNSVRRRACTRVKPRR